MTNDIRDLNIDELDTEYKSGDLMLTFQIEWIHLCRVGYGLINKSLSSTGTLAAPNTMVATFRCGQSHEAMNAPTRRPSPAFRATASLRVA
jgi:hypothetical protein